MALRDHSEIAVPACLAAQSVSFLAWFAFRIGGTQLESKSLATALADLNENDDPEGKPAQHGPFRM